jgi:hypothetical protein
VCFEGIASANLETKASRIFPDQLLGSNGGD